VVFEESFKLHPVLPYERLTTLYQYNVFKQLILLDSQQTLTFSSKDHAVSLLHLVPFFLLPLFLFWACVFFSLLVLSLFHCPSSSWFPCCSPSPLGFVELASINA
jgi:hypothetical protein